MYRSFRLVIQLSIRIYSSTSANSIPNVASTVTAKLSSVTHVCAKAKEYVLIGEAQIYAVSLSYCQVIQLK